MGNETFTLSLLLLSRLSHLQAELLLEVLQKDSKSLTQASVLEVVKINEGWQTLGPGGHRWWIVPLHVVLR